MWPEQRLSLFMAINNRKRKYSYYFSRKLIIAWFWRILINKSGLLWSLLICHCGRTQTNVVWYIVMQLLKLKTFCGHQRSNQRCLHITLWYVETVYKVSRFYRKMLQFFKVSCYTKIVGNIWIVSIWPEIMLIDRFLLFQGQYWRCSTRWQF